MSVFIDEYTQLSIRSHYCYTKTNGSPSPPSSIQFPRLIKKPEPISVTFNQFQAV